MLRGAIFDPRTWNSDFKPYFKPRRDVQIDLLPNGDGFSSNKYKFILATEVWEIPMREKLSKFRQQGVKVFFIPREPFKADIAEEAMFGYNKFYHKGEYYFKPDALFAPGKEYAKFWTDKIKSVHVTGYPRFDFYVDKNRWKSKSEVLSLHNIDPNKKIIFFPSYPPYVYKKEGSKDTLIDIFDEQEQTISALVEFVKNNSEFQLVIKIHPSSWKCYRKGIGTGKEVAGLLKRYLKSPESGITVIGDDRDAGMIAKDLLTVSDIVVGFNTTMLLEAAIINKPSVYIAFGKTLDMGKKLPDYYKDIPMAKNKNELHNAIINTKNTMSDEFVSRYLHKVDGNAWDRICNAIKIEFGENK